MIPLPKKPICPQYFKLFIEKFYKAENKTCNPYII